MIVLVLDPITGAFYAACHLHTSGLARGGESSCAEPIVMIKHELKTKLDWT